jgi:hypothetical protein
LNAFWFKYYFLQTLRGIIMTVTAAVPAPVPAETPAVPEEGSYEQRQAKVLGDMEKRAFNQMIFSEKTSEIQADVSLNEVKQSSAKALARKVENSGIQ